jgi:hypothetical protein
MLDMLRRIDEEAALTLPDSPMRLPVIIVGGSALLLHDLTRRPTTHDVDVLAYHDALRDILASYHALNSAVMAYVDQIPYNYEDRLLPIDLETKRVAFLTPSIEDLAVMKLYGWRPNDREDLNSPQFLERIDWRKLDRLVFDADEAQASALSPRRYREMVDIYTEYAREHGHEPNA